MNKKEDFQGNPFRRNLSSQLKTALKSGNAPAWWTAMANDPELFIAPRDGYLNVYHRGNSLVRLSASSDGRLVGEVHYKYLLRPELATAYWKMTHDGKLPNGDAGNLRLGDFFHDLNDLAGLKRSSKNFAGEEKSGIAKILARNSNVIDLEVAFGTPANDGEKSQIPRIDLVAAHKHGDGVALVFYEAKDYGNGELRSSAPNDVPVLNQMRKYEEEISRRRVEIAEAYRNHCRDLLEIAIPASKVADEDGGDFSSTRRELLELVAYHSDKLYVALQPRLLLFGFDQAQKTHSGWKIHLDKLVNGLSKDRITAAGDPAGIRLDRAVLVNDELWKYEPGEEPLLKGGS